MFSRIFVKTKRPEHLPRQELDTVSTQIHWKLLEVASICSHSAHQVVILLSTLTTQDRHLSLCAPSPQRQPNEPHHSHLSKTWLNLQVNWKDWLRGQTLGDLICPKWQSACGDRTKGGVRSWVAMAFCGRRAPSQDKDCAGHGENEALIMVRLNTGRETPPNAAALYLNSKLTAGDCLQAAQAAVPAAELNARFITTICTTERLGF